MPLGSALGSTLGSTLGSLAGGWRDGSAPVAAAVVVVDGEAPRASDPPPRPGPVAPSGPVAQWGPVDRRGPVASVSKLISTLAVLVAVEEGTIRLDQPAGPPGSTVAHLLAHASGMAPDDESTVAAPATRRIYSTAAFAVLARVVEAGTGMPFAGYVREAVTAPLGMLDTDVGGHPGAGYESTAADLGKLAAELLAPRLIDPVTLADATRPWWPDLAGVLPGFGRQDPNPGASGSRSAAPSARTGPGLVLARDLRALRPVRLVRLGRPRRTAGPRGGHRHPLRSVGCVGVARPVRRGDRARARAPARAPPRWPDLASAPPSKEPPCPRSTTSPPASSSTAPGPTPPRGAPMPSSIPPPGRRSPAWHRPARSTSTAPSTPRPRRSRAGPPPPRAGAPPRSTRWPTPSTATAPRSSSWSPATAASRCSTRRSTSTSSSTTSATSPVPPAASRRRRTRASTCPATRRSCAVSRSVSPG